jgi:hypothetical protein
VGHEEERDGRFMRDGRTEDAREQTTDTPGARRA